MLAPYFFLDPAVAPQFFHSRLATGGNAVSTRSHPTTTLRMTHFASCECAAEVQTVDHVVSDVQSTNLPMDCTA